MGKDLPVIQSSKEVFIWLCEYHVQKNQSVSLGFCGLISNKQKQKLSSSEEVWESLSTGMRFISGLFYDI